MPGGRRSELEQRPPAARLGVRELGVLVVPRHLQEALLHAVVEVGAAEDELAEPVDERLAVDERDPFPVADEVRAERAPGLGDATVRRQLDEVGDLVLSRSFVATRPSLTAAAPTRSSKSRAPNEKR